MQYVVFLQLIWGFIYLILRPAKHQVTYYVVIGITLEFKESVAISTSIPLISC